MLTILGTLLSSIFAGGATGLLGVLIQRFFDMKARSQDLELVRINNAHAIALADKEITKAEVGAKAQVDVADRDLQARIEEARADLQGREAEAAAAVQEASYRHDGAKFLTGAVLRSRSRFVLWTMAAVDAARGLVRPGLTAYLVVLTHLMYADMQSLLAKHGEEMALSTVRELQLQIVATILYLVTVAVVWWFGTRPPAQARK